MTEDTFIGLEDIEVNCTQAIWQKVLDELKPEALKMLNYGSKLGQGVVKGLVDVFNYELANEGASTFVLNVMGMPLNMTMTRFPEFSREKDQVTVNVEGMFTSDDMSQYVAEDEAFIDYAEQSDTQKEQLWIHQSTINSLLYDMKKVLPGGEGSGFDKQILVLLSEIKTYYGADADCEGILTFPKEANSSPVTISRENGVMIGDVDQGGLRLNLDILCAANAVDKKELAVTLDTGMHLKLDFEWNDFTVYAKFLDPQFMGTTATSYIGELDHHNWDMELTFVLKDITDDINIRFGELIDLTKLYPTLKFVTGIVAKTLLSPYVKDEYIMAGFSTHHDLK